VKVGRDEPPRPSIANCSFVLSESTRRATTRLSETPRAELDSIRRNLEAQYPRSLVESPNVVVERESPFNNIDKSLFVIEPTDPTDEVRCEDRQPRPRISRTPSNISLRREFSLTTYESEIFEPEEVYRHPRGGNAHPATSTKTWRDRLHRHIRIITRNVYGSTIIKRASKASKRH